MKLQNLHEGIQARTQRSRYKRHLMRDIHSYGHIVQEVTDAIIPILEQDELAIYQSMVADRQYYDELPDSVEEHYQTVDTIHASEYFQQQLRKTLQETWDKKWNSN